MVTEFGATATIAKPFGLHDLLEVVEKCLGSAA
jgi:hypothetical protein